MNIDTHVSENDSIESKLVNWKIDKASEIKNTLYTHVLSLLTPSVKSTTDIAWVIIYLPIYVLITECCKERVENLWLREKFYSCIAIYQTVL